MGVPASLIVIESQAEQLGFGRGELGFGEDARRLQVGELGELTHQVRGPGPAAGAGGGGGAAAAAAAACCACIAAICCLHLGDLLL